ncbi:MAG: FecR family protein [Porticoccaceae bacterium]
MMSPAPAIPQKLFEEAADWLLIMQERPLDSDETRTFQQWLARSGQHAQAWMRAEKLANALGGLPPQLAMAALDRPESAERRAALAKLALLIATVPLGWSAWHLGHRHPAFADYRSAVGEQRHLRIADGSRIILNTDSAIDVLMDDSRRLILLRAGEIHVETSSTRDARPFLVQTAQGRLRALGTRFTVRQFPATTHLAVLEGAVEVTLANGGSALVQAGHQTRFSAVSITSPSAAQVQDSTWTSGMLMADATPLGQFATELARYRRGHLRVDPTIAALPISGAYPLTDTDKTLNMLATTYPLTVNQTLFGYLTTLSPH